jgi:hypothetical protein
MVPVSAAEANAPVLSATEIVVAVVAVIGFRVEKFNPLELPDTITKSPTSKE